MSNHDQEDEKPLDPAAERVRRKMVRLLAGSLGVMALGLIAVFSAIVYRISADDAPDAVAEAVPAAAFAEEAAIAVPEGAEIRSVALDGGRALLHVAGPAGEALVLVDLASGAVLARRPVIAAGGGGAEADAGLGR